MKNNLLIAHFMGLEIMNSRDLSNSEPLVRLSQTTYLQRIQYDTSWDWLMKVVDKIENIPMPNDNWFNVMIGGSCYCVIQDATGDLNFEITGEEGTKLKSVYKACVEFIKYWNERALDRI